MDFTEVLFATDLKSEDKNALRQFLSFLKPFKPEKIHILAINTMGYFSQPTLIMKELLKEFREIVQDIPCETHFYKDVSVRRGIQQFSKDQRISLIGISNHERHPIKRIFQGSNVEMLINHSYIPVLAIDY
jgi:CMP-N-acetylneuraminic acid synthetase